ncbi:MAG: alanine--tRNA ligase-related protein [Halobacteriaceae archaeon]
MTEELYLTETTKQSIEATVEDVIDKRIVLDRTIFYPTGGGQPHDTGKIMTEDNTWEITDVSKRDRIYHTIDDSPPEIGTTVTEKLDWDRRFALMRYHTAQHLLSAILLDEYDAETTGNQLYPDRARIDCNYDRFTDTDLADIETRMNELVDDGRSVEWYTMDRETAESELDPERTRLSLLPDSITSVRIVEIEGIDRTACAGTHIDNTEKIGNVTITGRETKGSDAERIRFTLSE